MIILKTSRLRIRKLEIRDAPFVLKLVNEPAFMENIGDKGIRDLADARRYIRSGPWTRQQLPGYGQHLVELKTTGQAIGICGLLYREQLAITDIGFAFLEAFRGQGYAYEAANAVMEFGHNTLGIAVICGLTSEANTASIRLLEKLGLKFIRNVKTDADDPGTMFFAENTP